MTGLRRSLEAARVQWASNRLLRLGVWGIAALIWVQLLLWSGDVVKAGQERDASLREDIARLQAIVRERAWPQRAEDARQTVAALKALVWPEAERSLAEAAAQDWVRATAGKSGLVLRELNLIRASTDAAPATAGVASAPQGVRLRVGVELNRLALAAFLAEAARHEPAVLVDRLVLRPISLPPSAEIELRMPTRAGLRTGSEGTR